MATKTKPLTLDDFRGAARSTGVPCKLSRFITTQSPADAQTIRAAIRDTSVPCEAIARVLRDRGCTTSGDSIRRHRTGPCMWCDT